MVQLNMVPRLDSADSVKVRYLQLVLRHEDTKYHLYSMIQYVMFVCLLWKIEINFGCPETKNYKPVVIKNVLFSFQCNNTKKI